MDIKVGDKVAIMHESDEYGWIASEICEVQDVLTTLIRAGNEYFNRDDEMENVGSWQDRRLSFDPHHIREAENKARDEALALSSPSGHLLFLRHKSKL